METKEFLTNPFANLDISQFPQKKAGQNKQIEEKKEPGEECRLFMEAMNSLAASKPKKINHTGFTMAEQCNWPTAKVEKRSKPSKPKKELPDPKMPQDHEADEFLLAMRKTKPLDGKGRKVAPATPTKASRRILAPDFCDLIEESLTFALHYSDEYLEGRTRDVDEILMGRLRAGQMSPEAHLDLHGLNSMQAFEALRDFIRSSWYKGLRVVLLVPGRGRNSPDGRSVLRQKLQTWLTQEPFKRVVMAFCTAMPQDGGPGSVYALLRKFRKKGQIQWNIWPSDADLY